MGMELDSLIGFDKLEEAVSESQQLKSSEGYRLVPWLNWKEWSFVKDSLFSESLNSVSVALARISAWRGRGCVPVSVEVTASIIEIQQKDPHFRVGLPKDALLSEEMLSMLYCMAIMRFVNGVIEKTRKKEEVSIAVAAEKMGIPRMLIDIRHEGSHRDLPALQVVRNASIKALNWLVSHYWEPQSKAIPVQGDGRLEIRKEIEFSICELILCIKGKQNGGSSSSLLKGKRSRHGELLCGRNKFLNLMAMKSQKSSSKDCNTRISTILKKLVRIYSSYSSDVVSLLLESLLKAVSSSEHVQHVKDACLCPILERAMADWEVVILKFANRRPELVPVLLTTILDRIKAKDALKHGKVFSGEHVESSRSTSESREVKRLSLLFAWLVGKINRLTSKNSASLNEVPSAESNIHKNVLLQLLRQCLRVSAPGNNQLMNSATHLAELTGNSALVKKIQKLSLLAMPNVVITEEDHPSPLTTVDITQQKFSLQQAAKMLESVKQNRLKNKVPVTINVDEGNSNKRWVLAKSWNPCPIGLLPDSISSFGRLPILDCTDNSKGKDTEILKHHGAKRQASLDLQEVDVSTVKKINATAECSELNSEDDLSREDGKGYLLIGGIWRRVSEEELQAMKSDLQNTIQTFDKSFLSCSAEVGRHET